MLAFMLRRELYAQNSETFFLVSFDVIEIHSSNILSPLQFRDGETLDSCELSYDKFNGILTLINQEKVRELNRDYFDE